MRSPLQRPSPAFTFFVVQTGVWSALTVAFAAMILLAGWAEWDDAVYFSATTWLPWILIGPAVFWLARRFPLERGHLLRSVPLHLFACALCTIGILWLSAQLTPVRRPSGGRSGFRDARGERAGAASDGKVREGDVAQRGTASDATVSTDNTERPSAESAPAARASSRGSREREPGSSGYRRPRPAPDSVPGILRRWAFLGGLWPPFGSTLLRLNFSVALYLIVACAAQATSYYARAKEREKQALALAAGLQQAQLDALRLQLQPHFLFNTLNAISALVHRNPAAADELIAELSELLRMSLQTPEHEVRLARELELLNHYLAIERTRLGSRLRVVQEIDPALTTALVPTFILQPLAENAVRHGIEPRTAPGTITISARQDGDRIRLVVSDDGIGLQSPATNRRGVGLANTERRLRALHGGAASLSVQSRDSGGVEVTVVLPRRAANA